MNKSKWIKRIVTSIAALAIIIISVAVGVRSYNALLYDGNEVTVLLRKALGVIDLDKLSPTKRNAITGVWVSADEDNLYITIYHGMKDWQAEISWQDSGQPIVLSELQRFPNLRRLYLSGPPDKNIFEFSGVKGLSAIEEMNMPDYYDEAALEIISELPNMQHIWFTTLKDIDHSALSNAPSLSRIRIDGCENISLRDPDIAAYKIPAIRSPSDVPLSMRTLPTDPHIELFLGIFYMEDLSLMEALPNITSITLELSPLTDYSPISRLTNIRMLRIRTDYADWDESCLANLVTLQTLDVQNLKSLKTLEKLVNLRYLDAIAPANAQLEPMKSLNIFERHTEMIELLFNHPVESLDGLENSVHLTKLSISGLSNIDALSNLNELKWVSLGSNITDFSPLIGKPHITDLYIDGNPTNSDDVMKMLKTLPSLEFYTTTGTKASFKRADGFEVKGVTREQYASMMWRG